jgi:hypothetical protein
MTYFYSYTYYIIFTTTTCITYLAQCITVALHLHINIINVTLILNAMIYEMILDLNFPHLDEGVYFIFIQISLRI